MNNRNSEILEIVNIDGAIIGHAERAAIHGDPSLIHRVVHVLVFNDSNQLLLQKRSMNKDIAPGKWDTSVGGHINPGEDTRAAAKREMLEELGIADQDKIEFLYTFRYTNHHESELVSTFRCSYDGEIYFSREEIDEVRWWSLEEIRQNLGRDIFSGHFEHDIRKYLEI
jgi:isopentenyl-diphosphate delta-isomerase type 1